MSNIDLVVGIIITAITFGIGNIINPSKDFFLGQVVGSIIGASIIFMVDRTLSNLNSQSRQRRQMKHG